jgi:hypothetical protein
MIVVATPPAWTVVTTVLPAPGMVTTVLPGPTTAPLLLPVADVSGSKLDEPGPMMIWA